MSFNYTINQATCEDIEKHLNKCSKSFSPALDSYVNIPEYSKKLRATAVTIEAWHSDSLVGLSACYLNNIETLEGYITNVSVIQDFQGKGVAKQLMRNTIEEAVKNNFRTVKLEVEVNNKWAIELYRQYGFVLNGRQGNKYLMINRLLENNDVLVSICCVTFNHAEYIQTAIEGFLMQKTDFPIEILIHDDASTDGTAEIINEYERKHPDIIKPILQKENQFFQGRSISPIYQFPRAKGKYIAICEGDDYWIEHDKLARQAEFLEKNPDYALVASDMILVDNNGNVLPDSEMLSIQRRLRKQDVGFFDLLNYNLINTPTVFVRTDVIMELLRNNDSTDARMVMDQWFWLNIALDYKIRLSFDKTSAYRIRPHSLSRNTQAMKGRFHRIRFYVIIRYFRKGFYRNISKEETVILARACRGLLLSPILEPVQKMRILFELLKRPRLFTLIFFRHDQQLLK